MGAENGVTKMRYETTKGGVLGAVLGCGLLLVLTACQTIEAARSEAMIADVSQATLIQEDSSLFRAVTVDSVSGGENDPWWNGEVRNGEFAEALRLSLANHTMLAEEGGRYAVTAALHEVEAPDFGFDLTSTWAVQYRLVDLESGETVFDENVTESFTAYFSSAFYGLERARLANEGAMRTNIHAFLKLLIDKLDTDTDLISMQGSSPTVSIARLTVHDLRDARRAEALQ